MKNNSIALLDCNNFYVSCERLFNPALKNRPVVVLSNNDGCVVSRSQEAKDLAIPMGAPYFQYSSLLKRAGGVACSANFALYADLSDRVMSIVRTYAVHYEIYSIDEAFLTFNGADNEAAARTLRATILHYVGIPVSIGIGSTKTRAKLANKRAKKNSALQGVFDSTQLQDPDQLLRHVPVSDIWGIGRRTAKLLEHYAIKTAYDLAHADDRFIASLLNITGKKMVWELRGNPCIELQEYVAPQKSIACTRSFKNGITSKIQLEKSLVHFVARAGEKLREQKLLTNCMAIFIATGRYDKNNYYAPYREIELPYATDVTSTLLNYIQPVMNGLYRQGYEYKRAGVVLSDMVAAHEYQQPLFEDTQYHQKLRKITKVMDEVNALWGSHTVRSAAQERENKFFTIQSHRSPAYTTCWNSLPIVKAE